MHQERQDSVAVGAAKYGGEPEVGTHAPSFESEKKPYHDAPPEPFVDGTEWPRWSFWRAGIAEFMSSLLFLYITIQTVMGHKREEDPCLGAGTQGISWACGGIIFVLVYCTAGISGGHINPAVTFALFLARKISFNRAFYYMVCQCLGAICGAGIVKGFQPEIYQTLGGGTNSVAHGYTKGDGLGAEIVGTFVLVYVVFAATDAKRKARDSHVPALVPLPIGFAVYLVHLATIPITGTSINPARSLGAAVIFNTQHNAWADHWIFWIGPFTGAALAAAYHQLVIRALPFRKVQTQQTSLGL